MILSMTHTMALGHLKKTQSNSRNRFCLKKLSFFSVISTKLVYIVFELTIDNIKID